MEPLYRQIETLARRSMGRTPDLAIEEMPGGASTRRFFRVTSGRASAIAMYVPDSGTPNEVAKITESGRRWPFLEIRDLLEEHGVHVPKLIGEGCEQGLILVEDLGDTTLAAYLERAPERREAVYRAAVEAVAHAQRALGGLTGGSIVKERAFDFDLLRWELDHFRQWGIEGRGIALADTEREQLDESFDWLAATIAAWPRGFVHRDYQSRNLMVIGSAPDERLVWIDFQDALLGPRVYDLVALLNDSYQVFDEAFVEARLEDYAGALGLDASERTRVRHEFDLVTVQRKLKDAGRFVFIHHKKGDASYLPFVEPTIEKARRALSRLSAEPRMARLADLLAAS